MDVGFVWQTRIHNDEVEVGDVHTRLFPEETENQDVVLYCSW
jgi:hypothetical protein